jgi:hypothetical protein
MPFIHEWLVFGEFLPCCEKHFEKRIFCHKFLFFKTWNFKNQLKKKSPKIITPTHNMVGYCLDFSTCIFEYCQIWLNIFMDDCHLNNITKLEKKHIGFSVYGNV